MTPIRQIFITFSVILALEMVRVFFIIRNQRWLVRSDPFAGEMGRGRSFHRSRLLLKILTRIAGGYPFVFCQPFWREAAGQATMGGWGQYSNPPSS